MHHLVRLIYGCLLVAAPSAICWADGGTVRAIERDGQFQISVFTSPNPMVAGPVDVSVLVQDADTLAPVPEATVEMTLTPRNQTDAAVTLPATAQAATNKLFRACLVDLQPGWYNVDVICHAGPSRGQVGFSLEVGLPPPQLAVLWPWFTWPVVPIVLFGLHQCLARRRSR